jgi:predicted ester cyclase
MGILPTGKPVEVSDLTLLRIAEGKIVEEWYELNLLAVMKQLGVIPSAG